MIISRSPLRMRNAADKFVQKIKTQSKVTEHTFNNFFLPKIVPFMR